MSLFKTPLSKQTNILSYCPEATCIVRGNGEILFANECANELFEMNVLKGQNLNVIVNSDVSLDECVYEKQIFDITNDKVIEIIANKLPNEDVFVVTFHDVTESQTMIDNFVEEKHEEENTNKDKNCFIVKMANNLTSPIHSIIGFSQAILEGLGGSINEKQEKYLKIIYKNSNELLLLMEKLISLSQIEANLYEYKCKNFDVVNIANIAINEIKPKIEAKNLNITLNTDDLTKKTCYSDENVIKHAISNLLENALLSCDIGGITVKLSNPTFDYLTENGIQIPLNATESSMLMIQVTDTGSGLQAHELKDIFDPYIQVDKNAKKNLLKSLILGITKRFVEKLNGSIWVKSELLKESVYTIIIPIEKVSQEAPVIIAETAVSAQMPDDNDQPAEEGQE